MGFQGTEATGPVAEDRKFSLQCALAWSRLRCPAHSGPDPANAWWPAWKPSSTLRGVSADGLTLATDRVANVEESAQATHCHT
jgi:hypothetical protein